MTFRNEPRRILADSAEALGAPPAVADGIQELGWTIVWAQRPLLAVWQDDDGEYIIGPTWEKWDGGNHGFYAAGDPAGRINRNYEKTLADEWNSTDAYPVLLVTPDVLKDDLRDRLGDDFDTYYPQYVQMNRGDEQAALLEMARAEELL